MQPILQEAHRITFTPSTITTIDGLDVVTYLEEISLFANLQDPDALGSIYPGPNITLTFENGTTSTYENIATVKAGYFLNDTHPDVAVLSIPSFVATEKDEGEEGDSDEQEFQSIVQHFLSASKAADDLFKQLFPSLTPYSETRFRTTESFNIIGTELSSTAANFIPDNNNNATDSQAEAAAIFFNYGQDLTTSNQGLFLLER
ncbi:MAG: hypothetical protein M1812_006688 [Candelaria pacifica]|nr:MAG: hypothetical protein M1812_006688 [Candelaria pacifica]